MRKPVAVILVNWNTAEYTADCISSLKRNCDQSLFDIIVADNGSTDGSLETLRAKFPELMYIDNQENLGFSEGNNRALIYSLNIGYSYSLIINTDTLVEEDIITKLYQHLQQHPEAAAAQPAIYWMHNHGQIWNGNGRFSAVLGRTFSDTRIPDQSQVPAYQTAEWLTGCCMLIRNTALVETGLFNKQFFLYYEDVDLSFRLRQRGHQLHYLISCKIYHAAGVSAKVNSTKEGALSPVIHYYVSRNHLWLLRKYGTPLFYPINFVFNGLYYTALLIYFKFRGRHEKARQLIKGLKEGFFTSNRLIWPENK
ncbi:glycosyltransferase family 2 protein [Mucilaginibacter sabulilitoris]|uniref:Glycosyltransferase family 2 protein n=1 Tax=Mucilaginibacter sabulilitoris TaxID=1173583 RepID=A0ABZ0TRR5_9SPHI|nr:glycosyltransferase family 2 protein [Mucilaginibacter sabulilitoris]WPU95818.1 glycosyltransferase family 2 protein [Mucilaginibacter sabulilitoris]